MTDMDTLRRLNNSAIDNMAKRVTSLPANRGGARFGEIYVTRVKALCLWAKEKHLMNQAIDGNLFTNKTVRIETGGTLSVPCQFHHT
jgi:hypothetical protein